MKKWLLVVPWVVVASTSTAGYKVQIGYQGKLMSQAEIAVKDRTPDTDKQVGYLTGKIADLLNLSNELGSVESSAACVQTK